jgi:two-component system sensor histidine kinase GlrK
MLSAANQLDRAGNRAAAGNRQSGRRSGLSNRRHRGHALALAILFAVLIARPIRQLDLAVRRMGTADFTHAIEVNGPQDLRYLGQRLEWLRSRLQELEEQQNRFLRHVSHELKTPLTAVREGAELLRDNVGGTLSSEQREIVRIVRENSLSLQKLIEDLLTFHQTRAMGPPTLGTVSLPDVVRLVVKEHKLAAIARLVTVSANLGSASVIGDTEKIRTVVDNLVSNAIKYSPRSGTIALDLGIENRFAVLDVIDEGPGIEREERQRIFESFYQGRPPAEGRVKGSGLGLAIAREYALVHGGRIEASDRADGNRGAHFRRYSLAAAAGATAEKAMAPSAPVTITGRGDDCAGWRVGRGDALRRVWHAAAGYPGGEDDEPPTDHRSRQWWNIRRSSRWSRR